MKNDKRIGIIFMTGWFVLLFIVCPGCSSTQTASLPVDQSVPLQQDSLRFIVAADPQLFRGKKEDLEKAIECINDEEPEFVVMCGDLVETPSNPDQIQAYKDAVSKLSPRIALYNVAGNHDLGQPVKAENVRVYQENFGKLWYDFKRGNCLFIVLSSDILRDNDAPMNTPQTEWLTRTLEQSQSKVVPTIFVFMHHPLYLSSPDEPDGYSNLPTGIRRELLDLFVKYRVRAVFSGHLHDNKINSYEGIDLITTSSIAAPMGKAPAGFRVVNVHPEHYEQDYFPVNSLCNTLQGSKFPRVNL